jgi:MoaA/NifB/PqqE/SkfB family radical SAM enzyme
MNKEDIYTSTGAKFFRHKEQMENFRNGYSRSIITTHISPEGRCNLHCEYCSVKDREKHERIPTEVIQRYLVEVYNLGCKAVILTGGGEPTLYPDFLRLINSIENIGMQYALITNGTRIEEVHRFRFSWVRISVNYSDKWIRQFMDNKYKFREDTTVGLSFIYSGVNKRFSPMDLVVMADRVNAKYIRLLVDCTQSWVNMQEDYYRLREWIGNDYDDRFFIQDKTKRSPKSSICHQSYIRPYLSEIDGGTVFPCDSVPLNGTTGQFDMKYKLCSADNFRGYMLRIINQRFNSHTDCPGCVFWKNVNLLDDYITNNHNVYMVDEIEHENFV